MRIDKLIVRYGDVTALDICGLELERGTSYAVVGANGCGKSTLVRCIAGVLEPTAGAVALDPGDRVRYMPQRSYAFYGSTRANVLLGADSAPEAARRAEELMDALDLSALAQQKAKRLSGGQTARMALARTLVGPGTWLLLDEPTSALDGESMLKAERLVQEYRESHNAGVVYITHSLKQAARVSDMLVFMEGGRIVEMGRTGELLDNPQTPSLARFLELFGS